MSYEAGIVQEPCIKCRKPVEVTCVNPAPFCKLCGRVNALVNQMELERQAKDFEAADFARQELKTIGVIITNAKNNTDWQWIGKW